MLFKMLSDIPRLLSSLVSVLGRRTWGRAKRLDLGRRFFFPTDGTDSQSNDPYRHSPQNLNN
jgi:hypothetical protein